MTGFWASERRVSDRGGRDLANFATIATVSPYLDSRLNWRFATRTVVEGGLGWIAVGFFTDFWRQILPVFPRLISIGWDDCGRPPLW